MRSVHTPIFLSFRRYSILHGRPQPIVECFFLNFGMCSALHQSTRSTYRFSVTLPFTLSYTVFTHANPITHYFLIHTWRLTLCASPRHATGLQCDYFRSFQWAIMSSFIADLLCAAFRKNPCTSLRMLQSPFPAFSRVRTPRSICYLLARS